MTASSTGFLSEEGGKLRFMASLHAVRVLLCYGSRGNFCCENMESFRILSSFYLWNTCKIDVCLMAGLLLFIYVIERHINEVSDIIFVAYNVQNVSGF